MNPFARQLEAALRPRADAESAKAMAAYMRHRFPFLGVKRPELNAVVRTMQPPPEAEMESVVRDLWNLPEREFAYAALEVMDRTRRRRVPGSLHWMEDLVLRRSWWDTVDMLAARHLGGLLLRVPECRDPAVDRWRRSDNVWLRRTALLFQLSYKKHTDLILLRNLVEENRDSEEFFIRKAIGWVLREVSKTYPDWVRRLVAETELSALSRREAMKHLRRNESRY